MMGRVLTTLDDLSARLAVLSTQPADFPDEQIGLRVCKEALAAAGQGNYGVGAVLLDAEGRIVAHGGNQVFRPSFRSDLHAEMVVLNTFEREYPEIGNLWSYTLVSSLEPCPMCLARVLTAGVGTVKFLADDDHGGMAHRMTQLPGAWTRLAQGRTFQQAEVSEDLRQFAIDVVMQTVEECRERLFARSTAPTIQPG